MPHVDGRRILRTWWPLAASWLLMTGELPLLAAVVARRADPEVNLAAWGVTFPIALILASPIMSLMAASTALSRDWTSYRSLRRYMWGLSATITGLHLLLAYTPLFDLFVGRVIAAPAALWEPARIGLRIMLPWSLSLAVRRLNYGVLIRFDRSRAVTVGTLLRLAVDGGALLAFRYFPGVAGVQVAAATISCGVIGEALYAMWRVRPVLERQLRQQSPVSPRLTVAAFSGFYVPLVLTSLLQVVVQPIVGAALSRMPDPISSLAVWPVTYGLIIVVNSCAIAYIETVVVLLDEPGSYETLQRFALILGTGLTGVLLAMNLTPLSGLWFAQVAALPPHLLTPARTSLWIVTLLPALTTMQSWFQGVLLNRRRTRGITEAVALALVAMGLVLVLGMQTGRLSGLYVGMLSLVAAALVRNGWLWWRSRPVTAALRRPGPQPDLLRP